MRIVWASRHTMTTEQINDLNRIYGSFEIVQMDKTITDVKELLDCNADVYAVVLPTDLLAELVNSTSKDVIRPVSERIRTDGAVINPATGATESEYSYRHAGWQKIKKIDIQAEML